MSEKSLNDLPRDLRAIFTKGTEALQRDNFDYAIDLFNQVLLREPGLHECRKALRAAQRRKAGGRHGVHEKDVEQRQLLARRSPRGELALRKHPVGSDARSPSKS